VFVEGTMASPSLWEWDIFLDFHPEISAKSSEGSRVE